MELFIFNPIRICLRFPVARRSRRARIEVMSKSECRRPKTNRNQSIAHEMNSVTKLLLTVLVLGVYLLHQDFWNWKEARPLIFGFLPMGLAYHAAYSIVASILMAVLVKFAWPAHLENTQPENKAAASQPE